MAAACARFPRSITSRIICSVADSAAGASGWAAGNAGPATTPGERPASTAVSGVSWRCPCARALRHPSCFGGAGGVAQAVTHKLASTSASTAARATHPTRFVNIYAPRAYRP